MNHTRIKQIFLSYPCDEIHTSQVLSFFLELDDLTKPLTSDEERVFLAFTKCLKKPRKLWRFALIYGHTYLMKKLYFCQDLSVHFRKEMIKYGHFCLYTLNLPMLKWVIDEFNIWPMCDDAAVSQFIKHLMIHIPLIGKPAKPFLEFIKPRVKDDVYFQFLESVFGYTPFRTLFEPNFCDNNIDHIEQCLNKITFTDKPRVTKQSTTVHTAMRYNSENLHFRMFHALVCLLCMIGDHKSIKQLLTKVRSEYKLHYDQYKTWIILAIQFNHMDVLNLFRDQHSYNEKYIFFQPLASSVMNMTLQDCEKFSQHICFEHLNETSVYEMKECCLQLQRFDLLKFWLSHDPSMPGHSYFKVQLWPFCDRLMLTETICESIPNQRSAYNLMAHQLTIMEEYNIVDWNLKCADVFKPHIEIPHMLQCSRFKRKQVLSICLNSYISANYVKLFIWSCVSL